MTEPSETAVQQKTHELFHRAVFDDDDHGYPSSVSFVPGDQDWADESIWCSLHEERKAVVVVTAEREILLTPRRRNPVLRWLDGVRGEVPVLASSRAHGAEMYPVGVPIRMGRQARARLLPLL
jgi:hypothetical protein